MRNFTRGLPGPLKPSCLCSTPAEGVRGGGKALKPNISPFAVCWEMCGDTSAQSEGPCLDKTWQTRGPCPGGTASVAGRRSNINFQNTEICGGRKKKKNLSMVSMYLQPEALHPLGNVIPWLPTHQIELSDSGMARQTSLTNIWQPGQDNVSPPSFE